LKPPFKFRTPDGVGEPLAIAEKQSLEFMHHHERDKPPGFKLTVQSFR